MNETIMVINEKLVDIKKCLPMTMGDFRKLQKVGVDVTSIKPSDFEAQAQFCLVILQKSNPLLVIEDIDTLTAEEIGRISSYIAGHKEEINRPFVDGSTISTSSAQNTDGVQTKSPN